MEKQSKSTKNKNGTGSTRKRANGKWEGRISVRIAGKSVQKSVIGNTEREVKQKMQLLKEKYQEEQDLYSKFRIQQSEITVDEWIKIWIKDYKRISITESTLAGYVTKINAHISPFLGKFKIQSVKKTDIQAFVNYLYKYKNPKTHKPLARKTISDIIKITKMIFADAEEQADLIPFNPVKKPKLPKIESKKEKQILSIEEQLQVTTILLSEYNGIAYFTLFVLGVRASELAGFLWKDLDDILNGIHVKRGFQVIDIYDDNLNKVRSERKYTALKSETSNRIVPVIPILKEALLNYKKQIMKNLGITDEKLLDNESMFKTKSGSPVTSDYLRHRLHYVLKKYGFNKHITVHELRHTFATRCLECGIDMKVVQSLLGHADYSLTANTYSHVLRDTKSAQILKYNIYIKDTIQNNMKQIESMNDETIKDPVLHDKVVQTMKNTLEKLVEDKEKSKNRIIRYKNKLRLVRA